MTPLLAPVPAGLSERVQRSGASFLGRVAGGLAVAAVPMIISPRFLFERIGRSSILDEIEQILTSDRARDLPDRILATVLFSDIVGSTVRASQLGDRRWRELLEAHDLDVRRRVAAHGGRVVRSLGDGYLAAFDRPARALRCGRALSQEATSLGLQVRVGVHTGEFEVMNDDDMAGIAVHIGARVLAAASPGEVLATSVVRDLVTGSGIAFVDRGPHELRGVPGHWTLHAVKP